MPLYRFLYNFLNVLVQIVNKYGSQKRITHPKDYHLHTYCDVFAEYRNDGTVVPKEIGKGVAGVTLP
jgi:hypothetical protein